MHLWEAGPWRSDRLKQFDFFFRIEHENRHELGIDGNTHYFSVNSSGNSSHACFGLSTKKNWIQSRLEYRLVMQCTRGTHVRPQIRCEAMAKWLNVQIKLSQTQLDKINDGNDVCAACGRATSQLTYATAKSCNTVACMRRAMYVFQLESHLFQLTKRNGRMWNFECAFHLKRLFSFAPAKLRLTQAFLWLAFNWLHNRNCTRTDKKDSIRFSVRTSNKHYAETQTRHLLNLIDSILLWILSSVMTW